MIGYDQRQRLLRERWKDPQGLAEELFSMFSPDVPMRSNAPMTINLPDAMRAAGIAPINVTNDDGQPLIQINRGNGVSGGSINFTGGNFTYTLNGVTKPVTSSGGGGGGGGVPVWG